MKAGEHRPLRFPALPDDWEALEQTQDWQQAFNTPGGYAVITALSSGLYEIEFRGTPIEQTELSATAAFLKLTALVEQHREAALNASVARHPAGKQRVEPVTLPESFTCLRCEENPSLPHRVFCAVCAVYVDQMDAEAAR